MNEPTTVSELGTRMVMCTHTLGDGVMVTHDDEGNPVLSAQSGGVTVSVTLSHREALSIVEALVVAAKPGSADKTVHTDPEEAAKQIVQTLAEKTGQIVDEVKTRRRCQRDGCGKPAQPSGYYCSGACHLMVIDGAPRKSTC